MKDNDFIKVLAESNEPEADEYDYLCMAEEARTKKRKLIYLEKALELAPDNADVLVAKAKVTTTKLLDYLAALDEIIENEAARLKKEHIFKDYTGEFWLFTQTRPYMRARCERVQSLVSGGMLRLAAKECEEMLTLCENDNLGMRYMLMHLHAQLEEEYEALALYQRYPEESAQMLLPLSILYYKKRDLEKAANYLRQLNQCNTGLRVFLRACKNEEKMREIVENSNPYDYRVCSVEELVMDFIEYQFLFISTYSFIEWADSELKRKTPKSE